MYSADVIQTALEMFNGLYPAFAMVTAGCLIYSCYKYFRWMVDHQKLVDKRHRDFIFAMMDSYHETQLITEQDVEKAYETIQAYEKQKNDDKPKNDWRLGDDGEMVPMTPTEFLSSNER